MGQSLSVPMIHLLYGRKKKKKGLPPRETNVSVLSLYLYFFALLVPVQGVTSRVRSSQSRWHSIHSNWWHTNQYAIFMWRRCPFYFPIIRDSSLCHTDIANYFQISGRHFPFQLNRASSCDLRVAKQGCALSPEKWSVAFKKKKLKLNFYPAIRQCTEFTRVKTETRSVDAF